MNRGAEILSAGEYGLTVFRDFSIQETVEVSFPQRLILSKKLWLYLIFILIKADVRVSGNAVGSGSLRELCGGGGGVAGARQPQPVALPGGEQACLGTLVWMAFHLAFALTARALDKWCRPVQVKSILTFASGVTGL